METVGCGMLAINVDAVCFLGRALGDLIAINNEREVVFVTAKMFEPQAAEILEFKTLK